MSKDVTEKEFIEVFKQADLLYKQAKALNKIDGLYLRYVVRACAKIWKDGGQA